MEIWALYERTDLNRGGEYDYQNYRDDCRVFATFDDAKKAFRHRLKELATEGNSLFPDKDGLLHYKEYLEDEHEPDDAAIKHLIQSLIMDENFPSSKEDLLKYYIVLGGIHTNYCYASVFGEEDGRTSLLVRGDDDGPCNGWNPYIRINCFFMDDPDAQYSFHIEDAFDTESLDVGWTSHVFIDLKKVSVE